MKCKNCDTEENLLGPDYPEVCKDCFVDPKTNNCIKCNCHLENIPYQYVCGECWGGNV